jgi:hypothetical protein
MEDVILGKNKGYTLCTCKPYLYIMKSDVIKTLTNNFEASSYTTEEGIEFWLARDLPYV